MSLRSVLPLAALLALATPAITQAQSGGPLAILADPATGDALLWRAARMRLEAWRSGAAAPDQAALNRTAVQWANAPAPPDRNAEIASVVALTDAIIADLNARMAAARWPASRPADQWQRIASGRLALVRTDLATAARAGHSPEFALEGLVVVAVLMQGSEASAPAFTTLFDTADAAYQAALATISPGSDPALAAAINAAGQPTAPGVANAGVIDFNQPPRPGLGMPPAGPVAPVASGGPPELPADGPTQLGWLGSGPDVVSPASAYTDGRPDAFLWLRVAARGRAVRMINLSFRDPTTGLPCCGGWSTADNRYPFLGIGLGGGGISNAPAWRPDGIALPGEVIRLVAPGAEQFREGMTALATVLYADGSMDSAMAAVGPPSSGGRTMAPVIAGRGAGAPIPGAAAAPVYQPPAYQPPAYRPPAYQPSPPPRREPAYTAPRPGSPANTQIAPPAAAGPAAGPADTLMLNWIGLGGDLAANSGHPGPDNVADGVFELTFPATGKGVRAITLREVDVSTGEPRASMWSTSEGGWLSVATWRGRIITGTAHAPIAGLVLDRVRLFIADPGVLRSGRRFRATVTYADGSTATGHAMIP